MAGDELVLDDLAGPHELAGILDAGGWGHVRALTISLAATGPEPARLAELLAAPALAGVERLRLDVDAPLPAVVVDAIAGRGWRSLTLTGCAFDPQVIALAGAPALADLRELKLLFCEHLSRDAYDALAGATFGPALDTLWLWGSGADDDTVARLLRRTWPALRDLSLFGAPVTEIPPAMRAIVSLGPPTDRRAGPTQRERIDGALAIAAGPPSPEPFHALLRLLEGVDDEVYLRDIAARCETALAPWPVAARCAWQVRWRRPYARLARAVELHGPRLDDIHADWIEHARLSLARTDVLDPAALGAAFPSLASVGLGGDCTMDVLRDLPSTVHEVDITELAWRWLNEGDDYPRLLAALRASRVRRLLVGAGWWTRPEYAGELIGMPTPDRAGWLEL